MICGYIGTYTEPAFGGKARGIYSFTLNPKSGELKDLRLCAESINPSYLCLAPSGKYLYAVNELNEFGGKPSGTVSAFAVEGSSLRFLNRVASEGTSPCHIVLDAGGRFAVVSNYMSGTIAAFPVLADGSLGAAAQCIAFQEASHAHSFIFDPGNTYGIACDLGADRIRAYSFRGDMSHPLAEATIPWYSINYKAGPRHGVFHPSGKFFYVVNEQDSTVDIFRSDPSSGRLERLARRSTLPPEYSGEFANTASAVRLSIDRTSGTDTVLLYVSNRGHDSISVFRIGLEGIPEFASSVSSGGKTPRDFILDPSGSFLLAVNQNSDNLVIFRVDKAAASLSMVEEYNIPSAVSVVFGSPRHVDTFHP
jgi:6-phosphogluconolactonase